MNWVARAVTHGIASAGVNTMFGIDAGAGFISGLSGGLTGGMGADFGGDGLGGTFVRVAVAGTIGGVAANLAGGNFMQGFRTAAYMRLFNEEGKKLAVEGLKNLSKWSAALAAGTGWAARVPGPQQVGLLMLTAALEVTSVAADAYVDYVEGTPNDQLVGKGYSKVMSTMSGDIHPLLGTATGVVIDTLLEDAANRGGL